MNEFEIMEKRAMKDLDIIDMIKFKQQLIYLQKFILNKVMEDQKDRFKYFFKAKWYNEFASIQLPHADEYKKTENCFTATI